MKLRALVTRVRNIDTSPLRRSEVVEQRRPFANRSTAHLRLTGRALQKRNARIAQRDLYTCQTCGHVCDRREGEVDHRLPLSRGGSDADTNLQWLCIGCHRVKSQREQRPIA